MTPPAPPSTLDLELLAIAQALLEGLVKTLSDRGYDCDNRRSPGYALTCQVIATQHNGSNGDDLCDACVAIAVKEEYYTAASDFSDNPLANPLRDLRAFLDSHKPPIPEPIPDVEDPPHLPRLR